MEERLRILFVSAEVSPFARTGGLGDVVGALPLTLAAQGYDVRVVMPLYQEVRDRAVAMTPLIETLRTPLAFGERTARVWQSALDTNNEAQPVPVYLVEQDEYFARPGLYGDAGGDYADNPVRFIFFCRATLALTERLEWFPHVIHCHDWHTGLVPAYLRFLPDIDRRLTTAATVFTIHNLAYQGIFPASVLELTGLPLRLFQAAGVEFYGNVNFMKAGILYADALTTVSPTYAEEICTSAFGCGLDGVLRERRAALTGILNGVDYTVWDPATDPALAARYDAEDLAGKTICKTALLRRFGLLDDPEIPLCSMITRLTEQKGVDLVTNALERLFALDVNCVILGAGDRSYEERFSSLARRYPDRLGLRLGFNEALSHQIQAGSDYVLMPSRFEPCGLTQLYAMRYGAIPIVRATGGLRDTVAPFDPVTRQGTGFVFAEPTSEALWGAVRTAVAVFADKATWRQLQRNAMLQNFSWERSAQQYSEVYQRAVAEKQQT